MPINILVQRAYKTGPLRTCMPLDELLEGDGHLLLDSARLVHVAADAEQLGTCRTQDASSPLRQP
jgi:hypothetical protein